MIELRNSVAQIIQPGAAVTFDTVIFQSGCSEYHRQGTSAVRLRCNGTYKLEFSGNIASATAATPVQLAIALGGSALPETVMVSTSSAANAFQNVGTGTYVRNCDGFNQVTVVNTGTTPVTLSANFNLRIGRRG